MECNQRAKERQQSAISYYESMLRDVKDCYSKGKVHLDKILNKGVVPMNVVYTDGENKDFVLLCQQLDDNLNEIVGGEKQRKEYHQYNKLDQIHDVFLVYDMELPVGCASFKFYEEGVAEVKRVFVRNDYRGQGLSKLLMEQVENKAKEKGYQRLILETGKPLTAALGLYSSLGYKIIENYGQYKNMPLSICMSKEC